MIYMKYYLKKKKFIAVYLIILLIISAPMIFFIKFNNYDFMTILSLNITLLILPLAIASLLCDILILDRIEAKDIVCEINYLPRFRYVMLFIYLFLYIISIDSLFTGEVSASTLGFTSLYILIFASIMPTRFILTKDKLYTNSYHIEQDEIAKVEYINDNSARLILKNGKSRKYYAKNIKKLFDLL